MEGMEAKERWKGRLKDTGVRTPGLILGAILTLHTLLLDHVVVGTWEQRYGYFSQTSNSSVVLRQTTWNVRDSGQTEFSFRTCSNGELLFQQGAGGDFLKLLILNGTIEFHWSVNQTKDKVFIGSGLNDNEWYSVSSHKYLGKVFLNVTKAGNVLYSEEISNSTSRTYFLYLNLSGSSGLHVGRGLTGCLLEGPNVIFLNNPNLVWSNVEWSSGSCPRSDNSCVVADADSDDCYSHPCMYGGTCVDGLHNYTCQCLRLYNGTNCENDLIRDYGCAAEPCLNGGTCRENVSGMPPVSCLCVPGYTGVYCENDINECGPNPCHNNAPCIDLVNSFLCNCTGTGYNGSLCSTDINECENDRTLCSNGGTCFNTEGSFTCSCPEGRIGRHCEEIDECSSNPCQHNGTCTDLVNDFNCTCVTGYEGRTCEINVDDCAGITCDGANTQCQDMVNDFRCGCLPGYQIQGVGPDCVDINECIPDPCVHGTCQNLVNAYRCSCEPGYTGQNCQTEINECDPNPCIHGSCTDRLNGYNCSCDAGYTGVNCSQNINECVLTAEPCKNGGHCVDGIAGYTCDCAVGFTGSVCDLDINECEPNPCVYSPANSCSNLVGNFSCTCLPGYTGHRCEINIDDCASGPCKNNATCTDLVNGYNCTCSDEWMGETCEIVYDACTPELQNCKNDATCMTTQPSRVFTCACVAGYTGQDCGENIDDCVNHNCILPQVCHDELNGFHCACPSGYTGTNCDIEINECDSNPCQNNGTCQDLLNDYRCQCKYKVEKVPGGTNRTFETGFRGKNCEIDIDECAVRPTICLNVAQCTNNNGSFNCYCGSDTQGNYFTGSHCEVSSSYCMLSPIASADPPACHNGGTCYGEKRNFTCACAPGFTGWRCKTNIDECESDPCQYNGTCIDGINGYNCSCIPGITGPNCEINIDDCDPNPCGPGRCIDGINSYQCDCTDTGFKGENCSVNIDDCESAPCFHNATCQDKIKDFQCHCHPGYQSKQCEMDINECLSRPCQYNGTCYQRSIEAFYTDGTKGFENLTFSYASAAGYVCNCIDGITGPSCETNIDDCNHDNCNNGTCIDGINKFTCDCFPGYEGQFCAIEINECLRYRPCQNGASCTDLIADYSCQCAAASIGRPQYAGKNCTFELTSCRNNLCQNEATCQPYLIDEATARQDYRCLCTHGFTGRYCNISTTMSFDTGSYIMQDVLDASNASFSFRFRTTLKNSILLSWTGTHATGLFVTFELNDGNLLFQFHDVIARTGFESQTINGSSTFSNAQWQTVQVSKLNTTLKVVVISPNCISKNLCTIDTNFEPFAHDSATTDVRLGTAADPMSVNHTVSMTPFVGCMEDVTFFGTKLVLAAGSQNFVHIASGCPRLEQCIPDPCNARGMCIDLWNKHQCDCRRPYLGDACETGYVPATFGYNYQDSSATFSLPARLRDAVKTSFDMSFFLRTRKPDGLVVFFGDLQSNFVSLELHQGQLGIRTKFCDHSEYRLTSSDIFANGEQHFIHLLRSNNEFKFTAGTSQFTETVPLNCEFSASHLMFGGIIPVRSGRRRRETVTVPGKDVTDFSDTTKFKGTIQDARLNGVSLEFYPLSDTTLSDLPKLSVSSPVNLEENEKSSEMCSLLTPCENNSTCHDVFFDDYRCDCTLGYRGKNCSELDFCVIGTCPDGSACQSLNDGFECISTATFDGETSSAIYAHTLSNTSTVRTFSLKFRTLSMNGWIMRIENGNQYYKMRLTGSHIVVVYKLGTSPEKHLEVMRDVSNSVWYMAVVTETDDSVALTLTEDGSETVIASASGRKDSGTQLTDFLRHRDTIIVIGNVDEYHARDPYYHGCLKEVRIGKILLPFFMDDLFVNNTSVEKFLLQYKRDLNLGCTAGDMCRYSQCQHGSTCIADFYDYTCNCSSSYAGRWCQDAANYCIPSACAHGQCVSTSDNFLCRCPSGYLGDRCETDINECSTTPGICQNGRICQNYNGTYNCSCPELFGGDNCSVLLNQTCTDSPCVHGQCSSINITLTGTGEVVDSFQCDCSSTGYDGYTCSNEIDYCSSFPCENGGNCTSSLGGFTCSCPDGYDGDTCGNNIDDCASRAGVCQNGGQCVDGLNTYTCNCTEHWQGPYCTVDVNECTVRQPCENGGLCSNHDNGYTCNCTGTGFEGQNCDQDVNECDFPTTCLNGASCNNTRGSFECDCTVGYQGVNCQTPNCSEVPCTHSSTCTTVEVGTKWKCQCLNDFYEGDFCEVKGPCAYNPCFSVNTQYCSQNTTDNTYTCNCRPGWQGQNCTDDINECAASPCKNNATCANTPGSFRCECATGYEGPLCSVVTDNCDPLPCKNGGQCTNFVGYFECNCTSTGYTNETCVVDVDECEEINPCLHGGTCTNKIGDYECACPSGYQGKDCEIRVDSLMDEDITWYIVGPCVAVVLIIIVIVIVWVLLCLRKKRATRGAYSPSRQEVTGSRVELDNVLKKPPLERLI